MIDESSSDASAALTGNLRRLRVARRLSLSALARATGTSKATLSGIERGAANPTLETIAALARALQVSVAELLEAPPLGEITIVRAAASAHGHGDAPERSLEGILASGSVEVSELTVRARQLLERVARVDGSRAHLYVLAGKLIAGPVERVSELAAGDYASFPTDVPHQYEAGRVPARALLLASAGRPDLDGLSSTA